MKYIIFILFTFSSIFAIGQKKNSPLIAPAPNTYSKKEREQERKNHDCVHKTRKSFSLRLKNYPFNQAAQIRLVSFEGFILPEMNDSVCYAKLKEIKTLNLLQIDSLSDIFYNVGFGGVILLSEELGCYDPRNAILFVDKSGKTFAYVEICFHCSQTRESSKKISIGDLCDQKFDMLKQLFSNAGIIYGLKDGEHGD